MDRTLAERPLLEWLLQRYPDTPKTRAKQWVQAGRVSVGGSIRRKPQELMPDPGETLELLGRQAATLDCGSGWQIHPRLELIFLDSALAVVNKGPGLISVPAPNADLSALSILADFLAGKFRALKRGPLGNTLPSAYRDLEPLPVHRLDQYTTGLFCMALNPAARACLIDQLRAHTMKREYIAYVEGRPPHPRGTWRHWLETGEDALKQRVSGTGKPRTSSKAKEAITHYEVTAEYRLARAGAVVSKMRLRLETGRKHQIRVQAAYEGLPLIGDRTYNPNYADRAHPAGPIPFSRQALHSEVLTLEHPERAGQRMTWQAELPRDLRELEQLLRAHRI